ncbi:tetratricopeptide repeat protein [Streptomyces sp. MBT58]|nr:tetratricopeptide repeat protein [Streptomyces sp. MBT58]
MNTSAQTRAGRGGQVAGKEAEREAALTELRTRLNNGLARSRLTKTQLASQARRSRTTIQESLRTGAPAPSAETVVALARVLRLEDDELLRLQRTAAGETSSLIGPTLVPGRRIGDWDPHDLEIHPAGFSSDKRDSGARPRVLPLYVMRAHDQVLADTVREVGEGRSRMVILVGTSSTGKTRACWEAVQPLATSDWLLWHPFDPTRVEAALHDLERVRPHTVVWLNEAHHYLGDPRAGEQVAAALHSLLTHPDRQPTLILGTLWPEYADRYAALPAPGETDQHSRVRELLAGRTVTIPDTFDQTALRTAAALASQGDLLLADSLTRTRADGRVTQDLAGAPALLHRYEHASPAARALLEAAMDARRLGLGIRLPQAFLTEAAADYLDSKDYDELTDDWAEAAYADLARPVHGKQAPLRRTVLRPEQRPPGRAASSAERVASAGPLFQIADYLEQHGRTSRKHLCPPLSFWAAAHEHLTHPSDLRSLAAAAHNRHRLEWADALLHRAAQAGHPNALIDLAHIRERDGNREDAKTLLRRAAEAGHVTALFSLGQIHEADGDWPSAESYYQRAADNGSANALMILIRVREAAGDQEAAETLLRRAADGDRIKSPVSLAKHRDRNRESSQTPIQQGTETGRIKSPVSLAKHRDRNRESARALIQHATDASTTSVLIDLARMREAAGNRQAAETLFQRAADAGHTSALVILMQMREEDGDREGAETFYQRAADAGHSNALFILMQMREKNRDKEGARTLLSNAAEIGHTNAMVKLARRLERDGDVAGAETLLRQTADFGDARQFSRSGRWPYGLDPDGTPTPPW